MAAMRAFASDQSGQEFWLVVDKGYTPVGMVLGNCVYSMGAFQGWLANIKGAFRGEVSDVTRLMYEARELAITRMQDEASRRLRRRRARRLTSGPRYPPPLSPCFCSPCKKDGVP